MKNLLTVLLITVSISVFSQDYWTVTELAPMPEPVSNNAVAGAMLSGDYHVFSFMGIDSTKLWSGIHSRGFRYNTSTDFWDTIPPVPDNLTRIAGAASTVKNKIYIIGGYHVYSNGSEVSSKNIFIYNPDSNSYSQGSDLIKSTDDHVQCVWRDSLIYIITGWSTTGNIPNVQIYDPANDTVFSGTSTPNNDDYKAFGASGVIIGDTIYYAGGVNDSWIFTIQPRLRIGVIDPNQPDSITWSFSADTTVNIYRSAATPFNDLVGGVAVNPIWIGGAGSSYNYDGLEYGTGMGINPNDNVTLFEKSTGSFSIDTAIGLDIMDLRGIARFEGANRYIIAGGMGPGQIVSNKTYQIGYIVPLGISKTVDKRPNLAIFPNPTTLSVELKSSDPSLNSDWSIYDSSGKMIDTGSLISGTATVNTSRYSAGIYLVRMKTKMGILSQKFIVTR